MDRVRVGSGLDLLNRSRQGGQGAAALPASRGPIPAVRTAGTSPAARPSPFPLACSVLGLLLLAPWTLLHAQPEDTSEEDDIPVIGRPADLPFSGASGRFRVSATAEPTDLEAETPLRLTLRVQAAGPVKHPPQRLDLRQVHAFAERFYFEDPPGENTRHPDPGTWEFIYGLKPRGVDVTEVPGIPFVFFDPTIRPADRAFQVLFTDPIPLRVRPHEVVPVPVEGPEEAFQVDAGPAVLAEDSRVEPWRPPGLLAAVVWLLAPPLVCLAWYAGWQRLYPDAARQARQRRSRAARLALRRLEAVRRLPEAERAVRADAVVADYLRERLDLVPAEPTPAEAAGHLGHKGCSDELAAQAARFFEACDAARFLPFASADGPDLAEVAQQLVLAVEAETCSPAGS